MTISTNKNNQTPCRIDCFLGLVIAIFFKNIALCFCVITTSHRTSPNKYFVSRLRIALKILIANDVLVYASMRGSIILLPTNMVNLDRSCILPSHLPKEISQLKIKKNMRNYNHQLFILRQYLKMKLLCTCSSRLILQPG